MSDLESDNEKIVSTPHRGSSLKQHLAISTALASVVLLGYGGRNAYAACTGAGGTYICTGNAAANPNTIALTGSPLNVTTTSGFAISTAVNGGAAFDLDGTDGLTFTDNFASDITGATYGIDADNVTSGALSITTTGIVTGLGNTAITAFNSSGGTNLTIDAGEVTGSNIGIDTNNEGSGFLSITASGDVVGSSGHGIESDNSSTGTNLTIDVSNVTALGGEGIIAFNYGSGFLSITSSGHVDGSFNGIAARNSSDGSNLTIDVADVTGGNYSGIVAQNRGSGFLSITASGDVNGGADYSGVYADNDGTNLIIDVANVTGATYGIYAKNDGSGFLSITTTGTVDGDTETGIYAHNRTGGTNLSIDSANVTGATHGIYAKNDGSGFLSITTTGTVDGDTETGIYADNRIGGTNLSIDSANVSGATYGIYAANSGSGFLSITASGDVEGISRYGIDADNAIYGTDLSIDVANVTGGINGIDADHDGSGYLSIMASGHIAAGSGNGIVANADSNSKGVTINAASVTGGARGILASNTGSGILSITTTGTVTASNSDGIAATNTTAAGTDLIINTAAVIGDSFGILAQNQGSGRLSIMSTGTVSGTTEVGIRADNGTAGTDLTISVASVTGGDGGILAINNGSGHLSITATGPVTSGASGDGISVSAGADVTGVMINVVDVSGADYGIDVTNNGSNSPAAITVSGAVNGLSDGGIRNSTLFGTMSTITLNSGANVYGTNGTSITDGVGDTTVLVKSGAEVRGNVELGLGSDNLIFDGGTFGAGDILDGGDDTSSADGYVDRLTINGMTDTVLTSQIINWEQLAFVGSDFDITGDLATPELLSLTGGSILTVDGNFDGVADGKLELDADLANDSASRLVVTGNTTGTTTISVDAGSTGPATGNDITLVTVNGTKAAGDFVLDGNPIGAYVFDLALSGDDFALTNATLSPETPVFEAFPRVLASLNGISNFNERFGERYFAATDSAALGYALMGYASTDAALETDDVQRNNAVWARIEGSHSKLASAQSTTSSEFDINQGKLQVGLDAMLADAEQGALFVGVNASYGKARSDISSSFGNGQIDASSTAIGASLTWLASNGFYADGQAQFSWFNSDISSDGLGQLESGNDGTGYVFGLEIGHRFENSNGVAITPQAQLIFSDIDFEDFTSAYGTSVTADETESLNLRVGLAVERGFSVVDDAGNGGFGNVQLIANVYHEFRNEMSVSVAGTPLANEADDWTGELGLGGSFTSADGIYTVFGNASASSGLDNTFDSYAFDGSAGVKVAF